MLPSKPSGKTIYQKYKPIRLLKRVQSHDWLWLIAFAVISCCNGWFLRASSQPLGIVIYFALFPLIYIIYNVAEYFRVLGFLVITSWSVLSFTIVNLNLPSPYVVAILLYGIHIFFFGFVLIDVVSDSGLFMLLFIVVIALILLKLSNWEIILRLIWFCNMLVTASNAGSRLNRFSHNYPASIVILTGASAFGLGLGWLLGGI